MLFFSYFFFTITFYFSPLRIKIRVIQELRKKASGKALFELTKKNSFLCSLSESSVNKRVTISSKLGVSVLEFIEESLVSGGSNNSIPFTFVEKLAEKTQLYQEDLQIFILKKYLSSPSQPKKKDYGSFIDGEKKLFQTEKPPTLEDPIFIDDFESPPMKPKKIFKEENDEEKGLKKEIEQDEQDELFVQNEENEESEDGEHRNGFYEGRTDIELSNGSSYEDVGLIVLANDNGEIMQCFIDSQAVSKYSKAGMKEALRSIHHKNLCHVFNKGFSRL